MISKTKLHLIRYYYNYETISKYLIKNIENLPKITKIEMQFDIHNHLKLFSDNLYSQEEVEIYFFLIIFFFFGNKPSLKVKKKGLKSQSVDKLLYKIYYTNNYTILSLLLNLYIEKINKQKNLALHNTKDTNFIFTYFFNINKFSSFRDFLSSSFSGNIFTLINIKVKIRGKNYKNIKNFIYNLPFF
jgi:hypothetical protein